MLPEKNLIKINGTEGHSGRWFVWSWPCFGQSKDPSTSVFFKKGPRPQKTSCTSKHIFGGLGPMRSDSPVTGPVCISDMQCWQKLRLPQFQSLKQLYGADRISRSPAFSFNLTNSTSSSFQHKVEIETRSCRRNDKTAFRKKIWSMIELNGARRHSDQSIV